MRCRVRKLKKILWFLCKVRDSLLRQEAAGISAAFVLSCNIPGACEPGGYGILNHRLHLFKCFALSDATGERRNLRPISGLGCTAFVDDGL